MDVAPWCFGLEILQVGWGIEHLLRKHNTIRCYPKSVHVVFLWIGPVASAMVDIWNLTRKSYCRMWQGARVENGVELESHNTSYVSLELHKLAHILLEYESHIPSWRRHLHIPPVVRNMISYHFSTLWCFRPYILILWHPLSTDPPTTHPSWLCRPNQNFYPRFRSFINSTRITSSTVL